MLSKSEILPQHAEDTKTSKNTKGHKSQKNKEGSEKMAQVEVEKEEHTNSVEYRSSLNKLLIGATSITAF